MAFKPGVTEQFTALCTEKKQNIRTLIAARHRRDVIPKFIYFRQTPCPVSVYCKILENSLINDDMICNDVTIPQQHNERKCSLSAF